MDVNGLREITFRVFGWETEVIELCRTTLYHPYIFKLMKYLSDFDSTWWLVLIPLVALIYKYGSRVGLGLFTLTGVSVFICDFISYRLIKATVMRPRPDFLGYSCLAPDCWGFVSSHASNTFCTATMLTVFLGRRWAIPLFTMAACVSFSRIYLGKHYPLDVLFGALLGVVVGLTLLSLFNNTKLWWNSKAKSKAASGNKMTSHFNLLMGSEISR